MTADFRASRAMDFLFPHAAVALCWLIGCTCVLIALSWWIASDESRVSQRISRGWVGAGLTVLAVGLAYVDLVRASVALIACVFLYIVGRSTLPPKRVRGFRALTLAVSGVALIGLSFVVPSSISDSRASRHTRELEAIASHSVLLLAAARDFQLEHDRPPASVEELARAIMLTEPAITAPHGAPYEIDSAADGEFVLSAASKNEFTLGRYRYAPFVDVESDELQGWFLRVGDWVYVDD